MNRKNVKYCNSMSIIVDFKHCSEKFSGLPREMHERFRFLVNLYLYESRERTSLVSITLIDDTDGKPVRQFINWQKIVS